MRRLRAPGIAGLCLLALASLAAGCATHLPPSPRQAFQHPAAAAQASAPELPFVALNEWSWAQAGDRLPPFSSTRVSGSDFLGLYPADAFRVATSGCETCAAPAAAQWFLQDEIIGVPAGTSGAGDWLPSPVWLGAPAVVEDAQLASDGRSVTYDGNTYAFVLPPRNPLDRHGPDARTAHFLSQRPLRLRGAFAMHDGEPRFVARTLWPRDSALEKQGLALEPLRGGEMLSTLVSAQVFGDPRPFPSRLLFDSGQADSTWAGKPALAFVLSGAQGDDNGSHAGHLGIATGYVGPGGEWADWLVVNFYPHEANNSKGITSATLPMDNYLLDVNSGQLWYRPAYMLVAVLRRPEAAHAIQRALHEHLLDFYCHRFEYNRAGNNSTAMSVDPLRTLGWRIPGAGPSSRALGALGAPVATVTNGLATGRDLYRASTNDATRLLPRVAFEVMGHDLLYLAQAWQKEQDLTDFERQLARDVEAIAFVRLPQVPSSRPAGTYPIRSLLEFGTRALADPVEYPDSPADVPRRLPEHVASTCQQQDP